MLKSYIRLGDFLDLVCPYSVIELVHYKDGITIFKGYIADLQPYYYGMETITFTALDDVISIAVKPYTYKKGEH